MKLDHPRDACFKHCAGGFGTRDTPTLDERRSRGPISLHNAIVVALGSSLLHGEHGEGRPTAATRSYGRPLHGRGRR
jgi:hypothetical protein